MEYPSTKCRITALMLTVFSATQCVSEAYYLRSSSLPCKLYQPQDLYQLDCKSRGLETFPSTPDVSVTSIDLSGNQLRQITSSAFNDFASLLSINLQQNQLTIIECSPFSKLKRLATLNLSRNRLNHLVSTAFRGLRHLQSLDLSMNQLALFPDRLFDELSSLRTLDLGSNQLTTVPSNIFAPLVSLQNLLLKMNRFVSLSFNGINLSNLHLLTIGVEHWHEAIKISNKTFQNFGCSSLESLELEWFSRVEMEEGVLAPMKTLTHLTTSQAKIASLDLLDSKLESLKIQRTTGEIMFPGRALNPRSLKPLEKFNKTLSNLTLSSSLLKIEGDAFTKFQRLRTLNLSHNYLYDFADDAFHGLPNLQILDLSRNNMAEVPVRALSYLATHGNLIHLFLGGNRLGQDALSDITAPFESLKHLDFSNNKDNRRKWPTLDRDHFKDRSIKDRPYQTEWMKRMRPVSQFHLVTFAPHIQTINFRGTPVDITIVTNCSAIKDLDFSGCQINSGDDFAQKFSRLNLPNLQILKLSDNQIIKVSQGTFHATPLLEHLDLSNNVIRSIDSGTFSSLKKLTHLNLEDNRIMSVDGIGSMPKLRNLNLAQNIISVITENFLERSTFPDLRVVDISANPFLCDGTIHYFSRWIKTDNRVLLQPSMMYTCASPSEVAGKSVADITPSDYTYLLSTPTQKFLFIGVPVMVTFCLALCACYFCCCHGKSVDGLDYEFLNENVISTKV